jgi:putative AdoMet-dependent methyltransferase
MTEITDWLYNEFNQIGKDYASPDEVAVYDSSHARFRDTVAESEEILDLLDVSAGDTLLDIGCGTGVFAIQAGRRGLAVTALDISDAMLVYAQARAKEVGITNIHFARGGFLSLPENVSHLDYVTTSFSFHHLPDFWKLIALQNLHTVLSPAGRLFIQDVVIEEDACVSNINAFVDSQTEQGGDFLRLDAIEHFRDEYSTFTWVLEQMLERAGFNIESTETSHGVISRYVCSKNSRHPDIG